MWRFPVCLVLGGNQEKPEWVKECVRRHTDTDKWCLCWLKECTETEWSQRRLTNHQLLIRADQMPVMEAAGWNERFWGKGWRKEQAGKLMPSTSICGRKIHFVSGLTAAALHTSSFRNKQLHFRENPFQAGRIWKTNLLMAAGTFSPGKFFPNRICMFSVNAIRNGLQKWV